MKKYLSLDSFQSHFISYLTRCFPSISCYAAHSLWRWLFPSRFTEVRMRSQSPMYKTWGEQLRVSLTSADAAGVQHFWKVVLNTSVYAQAGNKGRKGSTTFVIQSHINHQIVSLSFSRLSLNLFRRIFLKWVGFAAFFLLVEDSLIWVQPQWK